MPIPEASALLHQMRAVCRVLQRILPAAAVANTPDETLTLWERVKRAAESLVYDLQRALDDPPTDGLVKFGDPVVRPLLKDPCLDRWPLAGVGGVPGAIVVMSCSAGPDGEDVDHARPYKPDKAQAA
jgi:hypothetical protein